MYVPIDEFIQCGEHGYHVRAAIHLFVTGGDIDNPEHTWLVCLACAARMDRDPAFRARSRVAFERYQQHMQPYFADGAKGGR